MHDLAVDIPSSGNPADSVGVWKIHRSFFSDRWKTFCKCELIELNRESMYQIGDITDIPIEDLEIIEKDVLDPGDLEKQVDLLMAKMYGGD